jgi:tripartite-type tricarboxylate transporter receptor subunit TctC
LSNSQQGVNMNAHVKRALLASAIAVTPAIHVSAQQYPEHPITVIAPFAVGTVADTGGRIIAEGLSKRLGRPVLFENVTGALGQIGAGRVLKEQPDGYTLCYCNDGTVVTVPASYLSLGKKPPYEAGDFTAIGQTTEMRFMLAVDRSLPVYNLAELVAYARAQPQGITMGAPSPTAAIITGLLKMVLGDKVVEVRYNKGGAPQAVLDLVAGTIQVLPANTNEVLSQAQAGRLRIIGAVGKKNPFAPDVPTLAEQVTPDTAEFVRRTEELEPWNGLLAPKGLPEAILERLSSALQETLADPDVLRRLKAAQLVVHRPEPAEFSKLVIGRQHAVTSILRDAKVRLR